MSYSKRNTLTGILFVAPATAGLLIFFIFPFLISLIYCFTKGNADLSFVGLNNFINLLTNLPFQIAAGNTLKFILIGVPLLLAVSLGLSLMLNSNFGGKSFYRAFMLFPLVVPVASVILVWQILFEKQGTLNNMLSILGLSPVEWIHSGNAFWILILMFIWKNFGYIIIIFLAGLNNIPKSYYEAAKIDGANSFNLFKSITIPFLIPTMFFAVVISIVNSFKIFREAYLLAGAYPNKSIYMLQHLINNNFTNLNYQRLSTAAFLVFVVIAALTIFLYSRENKYVLN